MTRTPVSESVTHVEKTDLKYTFSGDHEPVARVSPGATLVMETEITMGDMVRTLDEPFDNTLVPRPFVNPTTGPVAVEGATPGKDVLVCDIHEIEVIPPGVAAVLAKGGAFEDWLWRRDVPGGVYWRVVDIVDGMVEYSERIKIRAQPMMGVIATAPQIGAIPTSDNGVFGGNMDVQEIGVGCRVFLPVNVTGANFYLADSHAVQGDGELPGLGGIEIRTKTTLSLDLKARPKSMVWPRIETETHIGAIASARPLEDAFRLSVEELIAWMEEDYGFSKQEALLLLGQVAEARGTQIANPKYTYISKIRKDYLQ